MSPPTHTFFLSSKLMQVKCRTFASSVSVLIAVEFLTAITSPMVSDRAAQKMSDTQNIPKHLCIWNRGESSRVRLGQTGSSHWSLCVNFADAVTYLWWDFSAAAEVSVCVCLVCGTQWLGWSEDSPPFIVADARPAAVGARQQPPSCTHDGQVTNKAPNEIQCDMRPSSDFSLLPSETLDWI